MPDFLPINKEDMQQRGWYYCDFLLVTGDAYIDHPSFGTAIISRVLEDAGFHVAILSQPDYQSEKDFLAMGRPRYAVLINAGNIDSMVAHYTAAKKRRHDDAYTPGGLSSKRPDRAVTVYSMLARRAFPDIPVIIGGLEASLRRFAHYDYWSDQVMPSVLSSAGADALMYGMSERSVTQMAKNFKAGKKGNDLWKDIRGMGYFSAHAPEIPFPFVDCPSYDEVLTDKSAYARAVKLQYDHADHVSGKAILQPHGKRVFVQNPPAAPLTTAEMDKVYALPYARTYHPSYEALGGVPAIAEVQFSIIHNRGCFGACNFCALSFHQGRYISARSHDSVVQEAEQIAQHPDFKGYIHDVGGPTANFRSPSCKKQEEHGLCVDKRCLFPAACDQLETDHRDYLTLLRRLRAVQGVKKVFVRSGLRYDYMLADGNGEFLFELAKHHISGQLKVAPEHTSDNVLYYMGKPSFSVYEEFRERYTHINEKLDKKQYLVPYLMSSHPGATLDDAILLAQYLHKVGYSPQQVQDFYPTPGTLSTAMYYTELDPRTMQPVYVAKTVEEKALQRALLQYRRPDKRPIVLAALKKAGREDLIGFDQDCLIRPARGEHMGSPTAAAASRSDKPKSGNTDRKSKDKPQASRYAKSTDKPQESRYAKTADKPQASRYAKSADKPQASRYAKTTDKPQASRYAKSADKPQASHYEKSADKPQASHYEKSTDKPQASRYAKSADKPQAPRHAQAVDKSVRTEKSPSKPFQRKKGWAKAKKKK